MYFSDSRFNFCHYRAGGNLGDRVSVRTSTKGRNHIQSVNPLNTNIGSNNRKKLL